MPYDFPLVGRALLKYLQPSNIFRITSPRCTYRIHFPTVSKTNNDCVLHQPGSTESKKETRVPQLWKVACSSQFSLPLCFDLRGTFCFPPQATTASFYPDLDSYSGQFSCFCLSSLPKINTPKYWPKIKSSDS